jgi:hypothetical protein
MRSIEQMVWIDTGLVIALVQRKEWAAFALIYSPGYAMRQSIHIPPVFALNVELSISGLRIEPTSPWPTFVRVSGNHLRSELDAQVIVNYKSRQL